MSVAKPAEYASGGNVYEIFVRPTSTSEQSSDETESTSKPSSPTSIVTVEFPDEFKSDWEKIKASTPNASVAPIDYENLNATYATRIIETPREEFVGPPSSEPSSEPRPTTSNHSMCDIRIDAMKESIKVKDRLVTYLKADLDKFMVNGKNPYEKSLETLSRLYIQEKILSDLQDRLYLEKECAFEANIRDYELKSLDKAIFETDHISWTIPKAKVASDVNTLTPKPTTSSTKPHGKSVKNVKVTLDNKIKTSSSSSKLNEKKNIQLTKSKSAEKVVPKRNDMTRDVKRVGTDGEKSVKPSTSKSQRSHTEGTKPPLKANVHCKTIPGLIFEKNTFEIGENSKAKPDKTNSPNQKRFPTFVKPSSNSNSVPVTDTRRNEGPNDVKTKNPQKENLKP